MQEVDWETQWELHAPGYASGYLTVDLGDFVSGLEGCVFRMKPGPGFGDLSHPTTRLMCQLGLPFAKGRHVIDLGCGSGILSLAALKAGAISVIAIDIDPLAIAHGRTNVSLNEMRGINFYLPEKVPTLPKNPVVFLNMILSEQALAWENIPSLHGVRADIFVSGMLSEQESTFLNICKERKWKVTSQHEKEGWLAFHCSQ